MPRPSKPRSAFTGVTARPEHVAADLLVVPVFGRNDGFEDVPDVGRATAGALGRALASGEFGAKRYESFVTPTSGGGWKAPRVLFVGAGDQGAAAAERTRRIAAAAGYAARAHGAGAMAFLARGLDPSMLADGLTAAEFDVRRYKSDADQRTSYPDRVMVVLSGGDEVALGEAVARGRVVGECSNLARDLANEPGNILTPAEFARRVAGAATEVGLTVDVLDEERMRALGMRLLLSVARGSEESPRVVVIRHEPPGAPATPVLALVGKGVTFDSGGISIKPADLMDRMKHDMTGGAAVAGAMRALALLKSTHRVMGIIPMTENMPSGRATRPGDVVVGASGTSVEVINTDAEGRLILADALWYARELGATHLVDVATLTGACVVGLGRHVSGLFGTPTPWVETVRAAATVAGDRVWPMPIYEETGDELQSEIADLVNAAGRAGGAITAAAFLKRFAGDADWAHLDIAGTAWAETTQPYQPKGPTGVAVRTLIELGMTGGRATGE